MRRLVLAGTAAAMAVVVAGCVPGLVDGKARKLGAAKFRFDDVYVSNLDEDPKPQTLRRKVKPGARAKFQFKFQNEKGVPALIGVAATEGGSGFVVNYFVDGVNVTAAIIEPFDATPLSFAGIAPGKHTPVVLAKVKAPPGAAPGAKYEGTIVGYTDNPADTDAPGADGISFKVKVT